MQILFLGAPGAGKGTQCKRLAANLKLIHLSSGDLLREAVKNGTAAGMTAKSYMDQGKLVPDPVLIEMFAEKLSSPACAGGFILDGFPRNLAQAKALDELLVKIKKQLSCVIDINVADGLIHERITGRRVCSKKECATPFHIKFQPPKQEGICDACGAELMIRSDDKPELVDERLKAYHELTMPLIDYYKQKGLLETVEGEGEPEQIFKSILKVLKVAV